LSTARRRIVPGWRFVAAVDTAIVGDDDGHRQPVTADGLDFHAGKAKRAVTLDCDHGITRLGRGGDGVAHADTHYAPGPGVEPASRQLHIDDVAGQVQRVGTLIDHVDARVFCSTERMAPSAL
jgi:hypothetical protein